MFSRNKDVDSYFPMLETINRLVRNVNSNVPLGLNSCAIFPLGGGRAESVSMKWSRFPKGLEGSLGRWGAGESEVSLASDSTAIRSVGFRDGVGQEWSWSGIGAARAIGSQR